MDFSQYKFVLDIGRAVLDIGCVAYLIFFCYKLFEDTNSISVIKGFIAVIVIYLLANLADLKTLAWIFKYVVSYFVLLIVVLFQPEIRRMLSRIGQGGISGIKGKVSRETLNELTEAVFRMSSTHTGGLIILEKTVGLKQLLEEAVQFDAEVKAELLLSIFHKGSVLHDGAVIIQAERIKAARVMIPSIRVEALRSEKEGMGTRHRAGMAITMDTDAIVIIVSEETGQVSLCIQGKMECHLNFEQFGRRIHEAAGLETL